VCINPNNTNNVIVRKSEVKEKKITKADSMFFLFINNNTNKTVKKWIDNIKLIVETINDKADIHLLLPEKGEYTLKAITITGETIPLIPGYSSIGYMHHSVDCKNLPS
jgi:Lhr-like helicase